MQWHMSTSHILNGNHDIDCLLQQVKFVHAVFLSAWININSRLSRTRQIGRKGKTGQVRQHEQNGRMLVR